MINQKQQLYGCLILAIAAVVSITEAWVNILTLMENATHGFQRNAFFWFEISFELLYVVSLAVAAIFLVGGQIAQAAYTAALCVVLTVYTAVGNFSFVAGYAVDYSNSQKEGSLERQALEARLSALKSTDTTIVTVDINDKDATKWRNQIARADAKIAACIGKFTGNSGWFHQQRDKCKSNAVQLKMTAENNLLGYTEQSKRAADSVQTRQDTIKELGKVSNDLSQETNRFVPLPFVRLLADTIEEQIEYQRLLGAMFVVIVKLITMGCWWLGASLLKKEVHHTPENQQKAEPLENQQQTEPPRPSYTRNDHAPTWSNGQQSAWGAVAQSFMQPRAAAPSPASELVVERGHGESDVAGASESAYSGSSIGYSAPIRHRRTDIPQTRIDAPMPRSSECAQIDAANAPNHAAVVSASGRSESSTIGLSEVIDCVLSNNTLFFNGVISERKVQDFIGSGRPRAKRFIAELKAEGVLDATGRRIK